MGGWKASAAAAAAAKFQRERRFRAVSARVHTCCRSPQRDHLVLMLASARDRRTATLYSHATPDFKLDAVGNLRPQGVFTLLESRSYRRQVGIRDGTSPQSAGIPTPDTIYTPQYLLLSALLAGQMRGSCSI